MPFKPRTKRFALVPVEPGNEQDTDVRIEQDIIGNLELLGWEDDAFRLIVIAKGDQAIIAALGFPTEGEEA